jgi:hypothetical protein
MPESNPPPKPAEVKRILCLANSRKLSGRCVAGREIINGQPGAWIRPISAREHQEVSEHERQYEDGSDPNVLDVIDVPLTEPRPHHFQQENWLLDPNFYWLKVERCNWAGLQGFLDPADTLWINHQNSYNGLNDRVVLDQAEKLRSSLRLIRVDRLVVKVFRPGESFNNPKRRVQGQFAHAGVQHWLWITDPIYERRYLAQPDGMHNLGESCLTISLGEPHEGFCYKLIAAIIERAQIET